MPFINSLLKYTNDYFIETGTYQGDDMYQQKPLGTGKLYQCVDAIKRACSIQVLCILFIL